MTTPSPEALAPCPKCESANVGPDQFAAPPLRNRYVIECSDCDYMTATYETVEEAVAAWNQRTRPEPVAAGEPEDEASKLIRKAADLIKPAAEEVVFYLRVGGEYSQLTTHAGKNANPKELLTKAIEALSAERDDAINCPVHQPVGDEALVERVKYDKDAQSAVMSLLERGKATVDSDGYLTLAAIQAIPAPATGEREQIVGWLEDWIAQTLGQDISPQYLIEVLKRGDHRLAFTRPIP